jgi:hypothetical protein
VSDRIDTRSHRLEVVVPQPALELTAGDLEVLELPARDHAELAAGERCNPNSRRIDITMVSILPRFAHRRSVASPVATEHGAFVTTSPRSGNNSVTTAAARVRAQHEQIDRRAELLELLGRRPVGRVWLDAAEGLEAGAPIRR